MQRSDRLTAYLDHLKVTLDLINRSKRMDRTKFGPGERNHTARAVQFHRTASERDHRVDETKILGLQMIDVPKHLGL